MKVIIAGSRTIWDLKLIVKALEVSGVKVSEVVCGKAPGVDSVGESWAHGRNVPVQPFPAPWTMHRGLAGRIRNQRMANYADTLVAIWDGLSSGTADMIERMMELKKPTFVFNLRTGEAAWLN